MAFKMKYSIDTKYLPKGTNRRSGIKAAKIRFCVIHDTGNPNSTASGNINYYRNSPNISASAHTFIDDKEILECIPAVTGTPEKAWHVLYDRPKDNQLYGDDANDAAIGVELCYFPNDQARSIRAYEKYVWYCAYLAYYFKLDPAKCFVGHETLDPGRKTDPSNGLKHIGKTTAQCMKDIVAEYNECLGKTSSASPAPSSKTPYRVVVPNLAFWQARLLVSEYQKRGYKNCYGVELKKYKAGEKPEENDPYQFVIETVFETAKTLVVELQTRGYDRAYGEEK